MEQAQQANRDHSQAYTVTREYRFFNGDEQKPNSEVVAEISFVPPDRKTFTIEKVEGSNRGESIVKHILESEADATRKNSANVAIDDRNYNFDLLGEEAVDGRPCWILRLKPKHQRKDLVDGKAWVDRESNLIHRVEGDMAKSPSWWLRRVHVSMDFGNIGGLWMQKGTRAVADVRFFGTHVFTSEAVKIRTAEEVARATPPNFAPPAPLATVRPRPANATARTASPTGVKRRPLRPVPPVLGAGVIIR
jgi:hypothetical protein